MDVSVIIVNFNSKDFLKNCLESLFECLSGFDYEIILVNNDKTPLPKAYGSKVSVIEIGQNIGFGTACNQGAKFAKGKILFFLNPDTVINKFDFEKVKQRFAKSDTAILAPCIFFQDGLLQPWSAGTFLSFKLLLKSKLGLTKDISLDKNRIDFDWVSGAAFLIPKKIFHLYEFDEKFFMYFEDMDLCKRIKNDGFQIKRIGFLEIQHLGGKSYSDKKLQKKHYYDSQDLFFQKHHGVISYLILKTIRKIFVFLLNK